MQEDSADLHTIAGQHAGDSDSSLVDDMVNQERDEIIRNARRVLIKVGSAVLTNEDGLNNEVVEALARQVASLHRRGVEVILVSSGAVAAGRGMIRFQGLADLPEVRGIPDRQAASAIGQSRLMHTYDKAFDDHGILTAQILLTKDDFRSNQRFLNACNTFDALLAWGAIPIVNENDTIVVRELEFGDNDSLASLLLNLVEADLFVNLTSAAGVFDKNPLEHDDAALICCIHDIDNMDLRALCAGKTSVGSGGMFSKLLAARRAAQRGVPTLILSGKDIDAIHRAFSGEHLGTWVRATGKHVSRRKFRLAYNREPGGAVLLDEGAVRALTERGKSLLPAGIKSVEGNFVRGALVRILSMDRTTLGVGLSNYKAADLKRIAGKKSLEAEDILGYCYHEAIHRDNMLLDAAI